MRKTGDLAGTSLEKRCRCSERHLPRTRAARIKMSKAARVLRRVWRWLLFLFLSEDVK